AGAAGGRPGVRVPGALHLPLDLEAPGLRSVPARVAQALEGDAHLDLVAVLGDAPLGLEPVVRAVVDRAAPGPPRAADALGAHAVGLDPERVDREEEGAPAVLEGVEVEDHAVVAV